MRESCTGALLDDCLVTLNELLEVFSSELIVEFNTRFLADFFEDAFERAVIIFVHSLNPHDDIAIHLDKAAVAIVCKCGIARLFSECLHSLVVETKVKDCIHHARHRLTSAGTNRKQKRVFVCTKFFADLFFDLSDGSFHFSCKCLGILTTVVVEVGADISRDGETRRDGEADTGHLCEIGTFAAE